MRDAFVRTLEYLAEKDSRIIFLTADLGFKTFDQFQARFKDRFINVGVAEAQMISLAAGLSISGWKPIVYSISPFVTLRPLEQIRDDICYAKLPVIIVGAGGGYAYGPNGPTHHAIDDMGVMRVMPGMVVIAPGDPWEVEQALLAAIRLRKPVYLRLGRVGEPIIDAISKKFVVGCARKLKEGNDIALFVTGGIASVAMDVAYKLEKEGISIEVQQMHTIKPIDIKTLDQVAKRVQLIVTLEEHSPIGGLRSAVAEWHAQKDYAPPILSLSGPDDFAHESGSQEYFRKQYKLDAQSVAYTISNFLKVKKNEK